MATRPKLFPVEQLRKELEKTLSWSFSFRYKYTSDRVNAVLAYTWDSLDPAFKSPEWKIRAKWTTAQNDAFNKKVEAERQRIMVMAGPVAEAFILAHDPSLYVATHLKGNWLVIEVVSGLASTAATTPVTPTVAPKASDHIQDALSKM